MPSTGEPTYKTAAYYPRKGRWRRLPFVCDVSLVFQLFDSFRFPYLLSYLCFRSGLALHYIIGGETGPYGRHVLLNHTPVVQLCQGRCSCCCRYSSFIVCIITSLALN